MNSQFRAQFQGFFVHGNEIGAHKLPHCGKKGFRVKRKGAQTNRRSQEHDIQAFRAQALLFEHRGVDNRKALRIDRRVQPIKLGRAVVA